jgi:uncharacterized protein (DUF2236 family)
MASPQPEEYFDQSSVIRRVNGERVLALAGPRALLMQAAHPLAVTGLLAHSAALGDPYERLARTAEVMNTIVFGPRAEADRVTRTVRAMHRRVSGTLAEDAGMFPAGTPYRADDPELLLWILYTLVDSGMVVYELYVRSLSERERAAYWADYRVVGRLFGLRDGDMPATLDELRSYGRDMLTSGRLYVGPWARTRAREIVLEPPVPLWARPIVRSVNFVTIALLPEEIRRQYEFLELPDPLRRVPVKIGAEYLKRALLPLAPPSLRLVPGAR